MHYPGVGSEPGFAPSYDENGKLIKSGEEAYRGSIEGTEESVTDDNGKTTKGKWHRIIEASALSRIIQQPGKIDLTAIAKNDLARILLDATEEGGKITLDAKNISFTQGSTINADNLTLTNIAVSGGDVEGTYGASIQKATIKTCLINDCKIHSTLENAGYDENNTGFQFNSDGTFRISSKATDGTKFEITENSITIPKATIDSASVRSIVAKDAEIVDLIATKVSAKKVQATSVEATEGASSVLVSNGAINISNNKTNVVKITGTEITATSSTGIDNQSISLSGSLTTEDAPAASGKETS